LGDHHGVRGLGLLATAVVAAAATEDDDDHQADNATDDNGDDDPNAESHSGLQRLGTRQVDEQQDHTQDNLLELSKSCHIYPCC
jgi:hypothetical protein